ncbi:uncharacterized protein PRCAT00004923001 [Priceomyces carsonii]|uniref:uncharacterized protein n=1 Tax=Priceomyces carsonii TaxID=28549 RepID=UPI002ED9C480|nr:unnamed protein product [Priceomyces carsonii]
MVNNGEFGGPLGTPSEQKKDYRKDDMEGPSTPIIVTQNMQNDADSDGGAQFQGLGLGSFGQEPRVGDLRLLASANFSSESLPDANFSSQVYSPLTPTMNTTFNVNNSNNTPSYGNRRFSSSSLSNSPSIQYSTSPTTRGGASARSRPHSAIFLADSNNYAIAEDEDDSSSPTLAFPRNSLPNSKSYIPPVSVAPPIAPPNGMSSRSSSPTRSAPGSRGTRSYRSKSPVRRSASPVKSQPFNFQPQELMIHNNGSNLSLQVKSSYRRGHKYKHSSVSMNLFQEPPTALNSTEQLSIPDLYPIPKLSDLLSSLNSKQKMKLSWSFFHLSWSLIVFLTGFRFKLTSLSTFAHLIFYDAMGALVIVLVDIMSNFEVWNHSSISFPFGLGRLQVLVGFALSVSLVMVGSDLISHFFEEFIILMVVKDTENPHDGEQHVSHHVHPEHGNSTNWTVYQTVLLTSIVISYVTSKFILASQRINDMISSAEGSSIPKTLRSKETKAKFGLLDETLNKQVEKVGTFKEIAAVLTKNPTYLITFCYTLFLIVLPIFPDDLFKNFPIEVNELTSLVVALLLCHTGWILTKTLGGVLLLSYPYSDYDYHVLKSSITDKILHLESFKLTYLIEKFFATQFNYELYVVGVKIAMKGGSDDDESRIKFEINRIINNSIKEVESGGINSKIDITIDIDR